MRGNPAKQGKTTMIVAPVVAIGTNVRIALALVEERRINHVSKQPAIRQTADPQGDHGRPEGRTNPDQGLEIIHPSKNCWHSRHEDSCIEAPRRQCGRQSRNHIGQTAGFYQGIDFRCNV